MARHVMCSRNYTRLELISKSSLVNSGSYKGVMRLGRSVGCALEVGLRVDGWPVLTDWRTHNQLGGSVMHSPTHIYHFPNWLRTADRLDHAAARARIASAYARGEARRRDETARLLEELAGEFRSGEHGELL